MIESQVQRNVLNSPRESPILAKEAGCGGGAVLGGEGVNI